jgi:putative ATP-dependent endonuclease of OLD family
MGVADPMIKQSFSATSCEGSLDRCSVADYRRAPESVFMHLSALVAAGYRNLDGYYPLCHPLAVIVGENNSGKSNIIDALRTVLEPEQGPRHRYWLTPEDFRHDGTGTPTTDHLELEVQFGELTEPERARMVTCLAPSLGPDRARLRLRAQRRSDGRVSVQYFGGDSDNADVERHAREAVRYTYLHPLRDAAADLRPGRENRLIALLDALAPEGHPDRDAIVLAAENANVELGQIRTVQDAKHQVTTRLAQMTGAGRFAQQTDLTFADPRFERVVGAMRAQIGRLAPLEMAEGGLGFNNLLYMAVLLAALADPVDEHGLRLLLVEEPEAHLHPQLQDLLMQYLETEAQAGTQVIVTSHSPTFASAARVERLTVVSTDGDGTPVARRPADFGLSSKQLSHLRRFLDITKAALFFAKGVVLVEGVAEQLLLPVIASRIGRPLADNGVAVINIGGVAFPPFTDLFGPGRLPFPLAIVSDDDRQPDPDDLEGADEKMSPRAANLLERSTQNVHVALAPRTLEWALVEAGNKDLMLQALAQIKPRVAERLAVNLQDADDETAADAILDAVKDIKGQFAQELADLIVNPFRDFEVPAYLQTAIEWVTGPAG